MTAQPLPITDELNNDINSYGLKRSKITPIIRKSLEKRARLLFDKEPYHLVYDILGRIACLAKDFDGVVNNYDNALKLAPSDYMTRFHYFTSLSNLDLFSKAIEYGMLVLAKFPDDLNTLTLLVDNAVMIGRLQEASDFLSKLENPKEHRYYEIITEGLSIFKEVGLSNEEAGNLQNLAFNVLNGKKLYLKEVEVAIVDGCIHYQIYVDLLVEEIFELNWDVSEMLAENVDNMRSDVMLLEFKSVDILLERREA